MARAITPLLLLSLLLHFTLCISCRKLSQDPPTQPKATPADSSTSTEADVIIIGAGMAGITLARTLADNTTARVIVLEARERSGGRLHSIATPYGELLCAFHYELDKHSMYQLLHVPAPLQCHLSILNQEFYNALTMSSFTISIKTTFPNNPSIP